MTTEKKRRAYNHRNGYEIKSELKSRIKKLIAKNKEQADDNISQRKLIEKLTRVFKNFKDVLPDGFVDQACPIINEYERRFTIIPEKDKKDHPVFKGK